MIVVASNSSLKECSLDTTMSLLLVISFILFVYNIRLPIAAKASAAMALGAAKMILREFDEAIMVLMYLCNL